MQTVRWLTFCISNAVTRSIVHFFPASTNVAAPYAAECTLRLFGRDTPPKTVLLEGARFGQPDGVRLDDVFPQLQEGTSGFFGLEFSMATSQPRTDLNASGCILELSSRGHSCRFRPRMSVDVAETAAIVTQPLSSRARAALGIKDAFNSTSLVFVNNSAESCRPQVLVRSLVKDSEAPLVPVALDEIGPHSVIEVDLGEQFSGANGPIECSWGLVRAGGIWFSEPLPAGLGVYLMYRDIVTRRPVSVSVI